MSDLNFPPTSLATGCGYVAAGGQRSELIVKRPNSTWEAQTALGGSINNSMCIAPLPNGGINDPTADLQRARILVSNNDETIKVYDLPSLERHSTIRLPTSINYATVSPDGRKMVAVGDTPEVFLFDIAANGTFHQIATYTSSNDAGFSCAWNQWSDKFAVASQDGFVSIWDVQNSSKIAKVQTQQWANNGQGPGAARCVKFSPSGPIDLLAFTEHQNRVHVMDARTFDISQDLRIDDVVTPGPMPITSAINPQSETMTESTTSTSTSASSALENLGHTPPPEIVMNSYRNMTQWHGRSLSHASDVNISGICFSPDSNALFVGTESCILEYDVETVKRRSFGVSGRI